MKLKQSKQPQVIRLHSIDSTYRTHLYHSFTSVLESLTSVKLIPRNWSRDYATAFRLFNDCVFNYLTLLRTRKTLGEEYTYLNMFNQHDYDYEGVPVQNKRRLLLFILSTFFPAMLRKFLKSSYTEMLAECKTNNEGSVVKLIISRLPEFDDLADKLDRFVLMLFLIKGDFYSLVERFLQIKYIYLRHFKQTTISYHKEGFIILAQLVIELGTQIYSLYHLIKDLKQPKKEQQMPEPLAVHGQKETATCEICSDVISQKSATPCGHTFCWQCIIKWTEMKPECPSCRTQCLPSRIIQLRNY